MWFDYAIRSISNNKNSSIFLALISYLASTFLATLCCMAYNAWIDHVNQVIMKEGLYVYRIEPLLFAYGFVVFLACISIILLIHSAFEIPMRSRVHQLGILQSIGATPKQIRSLLLQETMILCAVPILLGVVSGIGLSYLLMDAVIGMTDAVRTYEVRFMCNLGVVLASLLVVTLTVLISALIPAKKLSKIMPLEAMGYGVDVPVTKMHRFRLFSGLFGIYGELARKSLFARRRELRTSTLSLAFAFLSLISLLNINAISAVSTKFTYFERFRDKWDLLLTVEEDQAGYRDEILALDEVTDCIAFRKAEGKTTVPEQSLSDDLKHTGIQNLNPAFHLSEEQAYRFSTPIIILDDESFGNYCAENQLEDRGIVLINKIWNSIESSRKYRSYLALVDSSQPITLDVDGNLLEINTFAQEMPKIKEEYQQYSMSLILSASYYADLKESLPTAETTYDIFLTSLDHDPKVQKQLNKLIADKKYVLESRLEDEAFELKVRAGLRALVLGFAGFLALIGIVNVFASTMGQVLQRRKEFARYYSVGISPSGIDTLQRIEAAFIFFKPLLLSLLINVPLVTWALNAAEISISEYVIYIPWVEICLFSLVVFFAIFLAYYFGGEKLRIGDLVETLRDETML